VTPVDRWARGRESDRRRPENPIAALQFSGGGLCAVVHQSFLARWADSVSVYFDGVAPAPKLRFRTLNGDGRVGHDLIYIAQRR